MNVQLITSVTLKISQLLSLVFHCWRYNKECNITRQNKTLFYKYCLELFIISEHTCRFQHRNERKWWTVVPIDIFLKNVQFFFAQTCRPSVWIPAHIHTFISQLPSSKLINKFRFCLSEYFPYYPHELLRVFIFRKCGKKSISL
jgi:hypothetical protein